MIYQYVCYRTRYNQCTVTTVYMCKCELKSCLIFVQNSLRFFFSAHRQRRMMFLLRFTLVCTHLSNLCTRVHLEIKVLSSSYCSQIFELNVLSFEEKPLCSSHISAFCVSNFWSFNDPERCTFDCAKQCTESGPNYGSK